MSNYDKIAAVLNGAPLETLNKAQLSALRLSIYNKACNVLGLPKERRREHLNGLPDSVSGLVEDEVRRIFEYRRKP